MPDPIPPTDSMAGSGRLKQIGLARLLHNLALLQRAGTLVLKRGEVSKSIFFKSGYVMFAESNLATDRLGEVLCRRGEITRAQLSECLAEAKKSGKMLGAVLVEKQVLRAERLLPAIEVQVREIVLGAFSWDDGDYTFTPQITGNTEEVLDLRIRTSDLIMEGVRRTYSAANASRAIGNTQLPPRLSAESGYLSQDLTVNFEISKVLAKVDGRRTIAQIVQETGLTELAVLQILAALAHLRILDVEQAAPMGAAPGPSAAPAGAQDIRVKAARVEEMRAHDEVTQLLDRLPPLVSQLAFEAKAATPEKMSAAGPTANEIAQSFGTGRRILDVLQERNYTLEMVRAVTTLFQAGVLRQISSAAQPAPAASWTPASPGAPSGSAPAKDGAWQVPKPPAGAPIGGGMPQPPIGGGMPQPPLGGGMPQPPPMSAGFPAPKNAPPPPPSSPSPTPAANAGPIQPPPWTGMKGPPGAPPTGGGLPSSPSEPMNAGFPATKTDPMNAGFPATKSDSMNAGFPATKGNGSAEPPIPIAPPAPAPKPAAGMP
ncbi:MAG TPA: DUF4388 domain-containing protein, partial [bacterium]|nr:DUF4388 domain-containing protein [bacterium]